MSYTCLIPSLHVVFNFCHRLRLFCVQDMIVTPNLNTDQHRAMIGEEELNLSGNNDIFSMYDLRRTLIDLGFDLVLQSANVWQSNGLFFV